MRIGTADLPLHGGRAPRWLVPRMERLARAILLFIADEYGELEILRRLSNPFWFQALSCVLGYDWHSSGTTTVTCAVLKKVLNELDLGVKVAGGKGKRALKTPDEIRALARPLGLGEEEVSLLVYASRMVAKVDNAALQDGHSVYHHTMFITEDGSWCVVQQGMNVRAKTARRYHWFSRNLKSFVNEPHSGILAQSKVKEVLNMVAEESEEARRASVDLAREGPERIRRLLLEARRPGQEGLERWLSGSPSGERVLRLNMVGLRVNWDALMEAYERQPSNYEELLSIRGVGPGTVRALALVAQVVYGVEASWRDPAVYSLAFGGKDGVPYPVNVGLMDEAINFLEEAVREARVGDREKAEAFKRLRNLLNLERLAP